MLLFEQPTFAAYMAQARAQVHVHAGVLGPRLGRKVGLSGAGLPQSDQHKIPNYSMPVSKCMYTFLKVKFCKCL